MGTQGGFYMKAQRGLSELTPLRSDDSQDSQMERMSRVSGGQNQHKGGYQARVHSDQMVLMMARQGGWGGGTVRQWPRTL
jgi:hypothetical protein